MKTIWFYKDVVTGKDVCVVLDGDQNDTFQDAYDDLAKKVGSRMGICEDDMRYKLLA